MEEEGISTTDRSMVDGASDWIICLSSLTTTTWTLCAVGTVASCTRYLCTSTVLSLLTNLSTWYKATATSR